MTYTTPFKDRLSGALLAIALQGAALSLFLFSSEVVRQERPERETVLFFPRPVLRQEEPVTIIDARGASRRDAVPASSASQPAAPAAQSAPFDAASAPVMPLPPRALSALGRELSGCAPEKLANLPPDQRAACPPPPAAAKNDLLTSPYQPKDQQRWDAEMQRKKDGVSRLLNPNPPNSNPVEIEPGARSEIGISAVVHDPLCQLVVLLAGTGSCGPPPPPPRAYTDAQFKAALDAYNKRRGGGPPAALTSMQQGENGNEKEPHGDAGDAPGNDAGATLPGR